MMCLSIYKLVFTHGPHTESVNSTRRLLPGPQAHACGAEAHYTVVLLQIISYVNKPANFLGSRSVCLFLFADLKEGVFFLPPLFCFARFVSWPGTWAACGGAIYLGFERSCKQIPKGKKLLGSTYKCRCHANHCTTDFFFTML